MREPKSQTVRTVSGFDGILFIGDVHLSSKRPGRRIDNYAKAGLDKLSQCAKIAKENNLYPVFLGDLFHRAGENNLELLAEVIRVCQQFPEPLLVLGGSHDRTESWFTEKDAAYVMQAAGAVSLIDEPGLQLILQVGSQRVALWATPAGYAIPLPITILILWGSTLVPFLCVKFRTVTCSSTGTCTRRHLLSSRERRFAITQGASHEYLWI